MQKNRELKRFLGGIRVAPQNKTAGVGLTGSYARPAFKIYIIYCKYLIYMLKSPRVALKKNIYIFFFPYPYPPLPLPRTFGGEEEGGRKGFP